MSPHLSPHLSPLLSRLLTQYMDATTGSSVASTGRPRSQDLALDYLQWLTGQGDFTLPKEWKPLDWVDQGPAQTLSTLAVYHPAAPESPRARHRLPPVPETGDIVVFDTVNGGLLGIFLDRGPHEWYVYTQGPGLAAVAAVPTDEYPPRGWWRPRRERLAVDHLRAWQAPTRYVAAP